MSSLIREGELGLETKEEIEEGRVPDSDQIPLVSIGLYALSRMLMSRLDDQALLFENERFDHALRCLLSFELPRLPLLARYLLRLDHLMAHRG